MPKYFYLIILTLLLGFFSSPDLTAQQGQTYESAIRSGEEMLSKKEYISAKTYFEIALRLRENDLYATQKLNETLVLLQQQMKIQEAFFRKMDLGDRLFQENKLEEALKAYHEALEIIPNDPYTTSQVDKISNTLADAQERNERYNQSMSLGDELVSQQRFEEAIVQFEQAKLIFPENELPKQKLAEAQALLAEQKVKEEQFNQYISEAEKLLARRDYAAAIGQFELALEVFPNDNSARQKLAEAISLKNRSERYEEVLAKADEAYAEKVFRESRAFYQQALEIWPEQTYPADMLSRISDMLNDKDFLNEEAFQEFLATANGHYDREEFNPALAVYKKALELKPEDGFVNGRIAEIQEYFAEIERLANLESAYLAALEAGRSAINREDYSAAISELNKAIQLKPEENEPKQLLTTAESMLSTLATQKQNLELYEATIEIADKQLADEAYADARASYVKAADIPVDVSYARAQIQKIDGILQELADAEALLTTYSNKISQADQLFSEMRYEEAKTRYAEALGIRPDENYPRQRIEEINGIFAQQLAQAEAIEEAYNQQIAEGDAHLSESHFEQALISYNKALGIKPEATLPRTKIAEVEQLIGQQQLAAEAESNYENKIAEADRLFANEELDNALIQYRSASAIFPDRNYPTQQISAINGLLAERTALLERQNRYEQLITNANEKFELQRWTESKGLYKEALTINPDESWPANQIVLIDEQLAELAKLAELTETYNERISLADQQFNNDQLNEAIETYTQALSIKPGEAYPTERIATIENIFAERKAAAEKAELILQTLAQADAYLQQSQFNEAEAAYNEVLRLEPGQPDALAKLAVINAMREEIARQNRENYREYMAVGDQFLAEKDYREAVTAYKTARSYMPDDALANQKINEAEGLLREYMLAITTEYNKLINEADRHFTAKAYDRAIESYTNAERVNPYETYPREMIRKIAQIIEENKLVEVNVTPILVNSNTTERFEFSPVNVSERRTNYILIRAKNMGTNEFPLIFSFGSSTGRNGGFVLPIPATDEYQDFVIRIGSQYRWFSEDNNWFSLSPENGNIEVGLVQISKGN
jgi:tetratricopeptide (TPR) repeat protein